MANSIAPHLLRGVYSYSVCAWNYFLPSARLCGLYLPIECKISIEAFRSVPRRDCALWNSATAAAAIFPLPTSTPLCPFVFRSGCSHRRNTAPSRRYRPLPARNTKTWEFLIIFLIKYFLKIYNLALALASGYVAYSIWLPRTNSLRFVDHGKSEHMDIPYQNSLWSTFLQAGNVCYV